MSTQARVEHLRRHQEFDTHLRTGGFGRSVSALHLLGFTDPFYYYVGTGFAEAARAKRRWFGGAQLAANPYHRRVAVADGEVAGSSPKARIFARALCRKPDASGNIGPNRPTTCGSTAASPWTSTTIKNGRRRIQQSGRLVQRARLLRLGFVLRTPRSVARSRTPTSSRPSEPEILREGAMSATSAFRHSTGVDPRVVARPSCTRAAPCAGPTSTRCSINPDGSQRDPSGGRARALQKAACGIKRSRSTRAAVAEDRHNRRC
jgi:hypothetical protein